MKRTRLLRYEPCEEPQVNRKDEEYVIGVSQILEADGEQAVEITLFYRGRIRGRYFADRKTHNAWVDGKWYTLRMKNVARICKDMEPLKGDYYYYGDDFKWASKEDQDRAQDFLDTYSLDSYEQNLAGKRAERAYNRKRERIDNMMAEVPCVPDDAERWADQKVFPGHFLFTRKTGKRTIYSCTACGCTSWKKKGWKHGTEIDCPKCGTHVTVNSRQKQRIRKEPVVILQKYGRKWVERQFKAICTWSPEGKDIKLYEQCRAIMQEGDRWGKVWYGLLNEADEFEQEFWDHNPKNKRFLSSFLYPGNLEEVLPYGKLEHSGMINMARAGKKFNVNRFIVKFHQIPWIEYLAKAGLYRMVAELVDNWWGAPGTICQYGQNLQEALQIDGNRVNRMKQVDGGINTLEWLQYEEAMKIRITQESLEWLAKKNVSMGECEDILKDLKSVNRMVNYMKKQKVEPGKMVTTWRDYLRMAKSEGYDTTDDIVRFPKDLKARHDQLVEIGNQRKDEERLQKYRELDQQIRSRLPEANRYFWEDDTYRIIPAGTCRELMKEGRTLHHCVGRDDHYMKKMAAGTSWILFLRKKEELEKPYYTVEIDMKEDRIIQYYSEFDRQPDKETISKILDKFKRSIKRSRQQERIQVTVEAIA
ncbi:MAG: PcfJ domain-containing protein [Hominisplanchenecus sp.]